MGEKLLDGEDVLALLEQGCGERVSQGMRGQLVFFDLRLFQIFFNEMPHRAAIDSLIALAQEQRRGECRFLPCL